jgi:steroid Delta-isomerase
VTDLQRAVEDHTSLFNACVASSDWSPFVVTFTDDAVMRFVNVPAGPYEGRAAIAAAYATTPPDDTMHITSVEELAPDTARARFVWDHGGNGAMTMRWRDGQVADLTVVFD